MKITKAFLAMKVCAVGRYRYHPFRKGKERLLAMENSSPVESIFFACCFVAERRK